MYSIQSSACGIGLIMVGQGILYTVRVVGLVMSAVLFLGFPMMIPLVRFSMARCLLSLFLFHFLWSIDRHVARVRSASFLSLYQAGLNLIPYSIMASASSCYRVLFLGIGIAPERSTCLSGSGAYMMHCLCQRSDELISFFRVLRGHLVLL